MEDNEIGPKTQKECIGKCIQGRLWALAELSKGLAERVETHLEPIAMSPVPCTEAETQKQEEWPPYFADLREIADTINRSLQHIDEVMSRVEI